MLKFYGKTYMYQGTVIGVCELHSGLFEGCGSYAYLDPQNGVHTTRMPGSVFETADRAQRGLDEFAQAEKLMEVQR